MGSFMIKGRAQACLLTITLCLTLRFSLSGHSSEFERRNCSVLQLLNVQPYPDDGVFAGFDRGLDLIPAAHLAAEEINNRSDILAGYDLQIVDIDSEACGRGIVTKGLVNFYRELVSQDPSQCIVGTMGFVCSSVTNVLAPIIGHENIGYVTLANSVSPAHRNTVEYPNLFHTISSSSVHNIVLISLMQNFGWNKIGVVYDSLSIFFRSTANDFIQRAQNITEIDVTVNVPITSSESISEAFNIINLEAARVTYWLGNDGQNALCLCEAYQREFLYPGHVFILRYHEKIVENILKANTECSKEELLRAMEGVLLMDYRLYVDDSIMLSSGWSYSEFRERYADKLKEYASEINETLSVNIYANSFYDQVWAFARALNNSIPSIESSNLSLSDYTIGNTGAISSIIRHELMNTDSLSFQGASGWIELNKENEIPSYVNIFQVINGTTMLVAIYDPVMQNVTFLKDIRESIPDDTFDTIYTLLPTWLAGSIFTAQAILFCLITTNTLLLVLWRKEKDIKATSPGLSVLMMVGCYLLWGTPIILMVYRTVMIDKEVLTFLCNLKTWLLVGLDFIFATLLVRLLRIQHIFRAKQMTVMSNYWLDKYLFVYILAICTGKLILLVVLTAVDPNHSHTTTQYVVPVHRLPYYAATLHCSNSSPQVWLAITLSYTGVILFMVMLLAIMTRHVKKGIYKDTKKVNVFIFSVVLSIAITLPLWFVFLESGNETGGNVAEWLASFAISTLCQLCIFIPKLLPLAINKTFRSTMLR